MNRRIHVCFIHLITAVLTICFLLAGCNIQKTAEENDSEVSSNGKPYGVFLGINREDSSVLEEYEMVVIEPSEFSDEDIASLHQEGKTVYAYLNVGSIEQYRPYYREFEKLTLDVYQDWPDERWIDVTNEAWQDFLISDLGYEISEMGFDGFFLDNCDVYSEYKTDAVFDGLCHILTGLNQYEMSILINGGDEFVSRMIEMGIAQNLIDGINQETVFTSIDFDTKTYSKQEEEETAYFTEYLKQVKEAGLKIYLLEYGADEKLTEEITSYCEENGFYWYNAPSLELNAK